MMKRLMFPFCLVAASCSAPGGPYETTTRAFTPASAPQQVPVFAPQNTQPSSVLRSNSSIARDILMLTFFLENGTPLSRLTRFEGPITVRISGEAPATMRNDLANLLSRLRNEAGIDISTTGSDTANITLELIPRAQINRLIPNAACFVAPNVRGLREYLSSRNSSANAWSKLTERSVMTIFLPKDSSPQEIRDCMQEELAQSLGPVNDLYYLSDSVFNDDDSHAVLTDFDMLVLRVLYDDQLSNGMGRGDVAARLSMILSKLNPTGDQIGGSQRQQISPDWNDQVETALGVGVSVDQRIRAAERAVVIARSNQFNDVRLGFSYYVLGRVTMTTNPSKSREAFLKADLAYSSVPDANVQRAIIATQLAAFTLAKGDSSGTLALVRPYLQIARDHENASLLSTLQLLEAEALDLAGRPAEARSVRLDSLGWARYGFGSETAVQARIREIAALSPR